MIDIYIKRVWGQADNFDIVLTQISKDEWQTTLPPDLIDGWYAVLLYAEDSKNRIGTWHGILYVANGFSHLHIQKEKFTWWLLPQKQLKFDLKPSRFEIILKKECEYHGA